MHKSVDLLSRREHSRKELQQKLLQREFLAEEISEVINYLVDNNYLSDQRYSESVFRLRVNKGFGKYYIEQELRQKGISNSLITALEQQQMIDWTAQAAVAYQKKICRYYDKRSKRKSETHSLFAIERFFNR